LKAEFSTPIRVYIEDTDAGGIVYYVNYLKYFERARTEFMRDLGFSKAAFPVDDGMFVVTAAEIRYRAPAKLDDELVATATVVESGAATLLFKQSVLREGETLVEGQVTIALVSAGSGRPRRLPVALRDAVEHTISHEAVEETLSE